MSKEEKQGMNKDDEILFLEFRKTNDESMRNQLVEKYLYIVDILVRKYLGKGIEYDDLYQVGALALVKAVDRFDPTKGFTFASFATPTILGEIKKHFRDKGWAIKVPRRLKEISGALPKVKEELSIELGRTPTPKEISERMSASEKEILLAMEAGLAYATFSINQTFEEEGEEGNLMFEKHLSTEEEGFKAVENREIIADVVKRLSPTNKYIFKKRFVEGRTQAEIAKELEISQMTVSRAEKNIRKEFEKELKTG